MHYQLHLNWDDFLQNYWQKQPVVLTKVFTGFIDPISPDELAGLALEHEVDSRLVIQQAGQWQVSHGPLAANIFDTLDERDWSLLVQAVNHWYPPVQALLAPFRILPDWRLEDVMISYSVPGGGVGPHVDQYDVFIIQGMGKRHWKVGAQQPLPQHQLYADLQQVAPFEPLIDVQMLAGDVLYIPPGFPHEGYALEKSLNYSVGFRAPDATELLSSFADYLLEHDLSKPRYSDPELSSRALAAAVTEHEITKMQQMMLAVIQDQTLFSDWLGCFLSQSRHELDLAPVHPAYHPDEIRVLLQQGHKLQRLAGLKVLRIGQQCFINGHPFTTHHSQAIEALTQHAAISMQSLDTALADQQFIEQLSCVINLGYWYFID